MRRPDTLKYLFDVAEACRLLAQFTSGKTLADYESDALLRSAVERQFEIIGEALRLAIREEPDLAGRISGSSRIIAFRNRLIHGYASVLNDEPRQANHPESGPLADEPLALPDRAGDDRCICSPLDTPQGLGRGYSVSEGSMPIEPSTLAQRPTSGPSPAAQSASNLSSRQAASSGIEPSRPLDEGAELRIVGHDKVLPIGRRIDAVQRCNGAPFAPHRWRYFSVETSVKFDGNFPAIESSGAYEPGRAEAAPSLSSDRSTSSTRRRRSATGSCRASSISPSSFVMERTLPTLYARTGPAEGTAVSTLPEPSSLERLGRELEA